MILYLDASALVKHYVAEPGTLEVNRAIFQAEVVGTALISRAEVVAALAKATRMGALTRKEATHSLQVFREEWPDFVRILITEIVIDRTDAFAGARPAGLRCCPPGRRIRMAGDVGRTGDTGHL